MSTNQTPAMTPDQVLEAWQKFDYAFPEEAFLVAVATDEALINRMLGEIEIVADYPELLDISRYWSSLFSLYVLAWHRESRVLAPLGRLFDKTGQDLAELWGDSVADDANRLFASWAYRDPALLRPFIEKQPSKAAEANRVAALDAHVILHNAGVLPAEEMRPYLTHLADSVLKKQANSRDDWLWYSWAQCCVCMGLDDLYPLVRKAYEEEWIDPTLSTWEHDEKAILAGREAVLERCRREYGGLIENPLVELADWHCFTEEARLEDEEHARDATREIAELREKKRDTFHHPDTIFNETPKTKPNQPCPCGSGKKYKKCCGRK